MSEDAPPHGHPGPDRGPEPDDSGFLHPYFLGPAAENQDLLESLVVEFLRDHAFWRRNFHPEDGLRISAGARHRPDFLEFQARTRAELHRLSADLKRAVPFFHPRYIGHMTGDLLLPGLVARLLTTLYNPNNVAEEAAPVTLEKELRVGEQLARMLGYATDPECEPCAWGHLTSGGTVANYEGLWNLRSVKFYGIALREGARATGWELEDVGPAGKPLSAYSKWELLNLSVDETIGLRRDVARRLEARADRGAFHDFALAVRAERIESLGTGGFFLKHTDVRAPRVLVSASAHYSWEKAMKVLGLGTANLVEVAVDDHMRMDPGDLRARLAEALEAEVPVLAVVGMLGTTEFGTVDPIHEIVAERERWRERGADFGVHVDAAWGGYLTSVFRRPDGGFRPREEVARGFRYFPSEVVYEAFRALPEADSITVDPHKLGYVPYAAGAFVARNREVVDFIAQEAAYVFDLGDEEREIPRREKLRKLGMYVLEGSKPGAAAASVDVTHRVLPLDETGFGRLLARTVRSCEYFWDTARERAEEWEERVRLVVPFEPDSNLVCLALNPVGNRDLAAMNRFGRRVFERMRVDPGQPVQAKTFIGSYTSLTRSGLPGPEADRILEELGIDPDTFVSVPSDPRRESDHVFLLRHTLMNPFLLDEPGEDREAGAAGGAGGGEGAAGGPNYVDLYWEHLDAVVREVLAENAPADGGGGPAGGA